MFTFWYAINGASSYLLFTLPQIITKYIKIFLIKDKYELELHNSK